MRATLAGTFPYHRLQSIHETTQSLQYIVAFVVGHAHYKHYPRLKNPINDAMAIRDVLKNQNAEVYYAEDCEIDEFEETFGLFLAAVRPRDAVFLYFAGHAVMLKNDLRLMAISNSSTSARPDIEANSLKLDLLIARSITTP